MTRFLLLALACLAPACKPAPAPAPATPATPSPYTITTIAPDITRDQAATLVERYATLATGKKAQTMLVRDDHPFYVVTVQLDSVPEPKLVRITKDGLRLVDGPVTNLIDTLRAFDADQRFAACLAEKQVKVYVKQNDQGSAQQVQQLGNFAGGLLIDCTAAEENCTRLGVTTYPSVGHGDKIEPGVHPRAWFETLTGCK